MALHGYLVEEIGHDYADGILSRREALRRLGLLGLTVTAAGAVLTACGGDDDDDGATATTAAGTGTTATSTAEPPGAENAIQAQAVTFAGPAGQLRGALAEAKSPKGTVLVVHENKGLTPHFFDVAGRLAGAGYTALAVDFVSRKGGTAAVGDEAAATAALNDTAKPDLTADLRAGIDELERRAPDKKIGAVGFCFGGGQVWELLQAGEARLAAAAPFYGPSPADPVDFTRAKAAVYAVYGETDTFVNPTRDRAEAALKAAGLTYEIKTFTGAGHAFFNNTGQRYNESAAKEAWSALLTWFGKHLA